MNPQLRQNWLKRLDAAQLDPSWSAQAEVRVLRFLLSRYEGAARESPVPVQPYYEGQAPHGRAKMPLSPRAQHGRLEHIAHQNGEARDKPACSAFEDFFVQEPSHREIRRRQKKKECGYW